MQPTDSKTDEPRAIQDRSLPIVITFILLLFFIISFFTLYLFHYVVEYLRTLRQRPIATPRGLPTSIISSFPTFTYSSVKDKDVRHGNDRPECTVCLAEFSDDDELRMLTGCSHVFHLECIDLWLQTHTTCPICRRDLGHGNNKKVEVVIQMPESNIRREGEGEAIAGRHEHRNSFKEDDCDMEGDNNDMDGRTQHREQLPAGQLSRSHSTGNSTDGKFRYGLHDQRSKSCTVLADIEVRHSSDHLKCDGSSNELR
ncbi:hypothetical protein ACLOJK_033865 [Asimina triloba]